MVLCVCVWERSGRKFSKWLPEIGPGEGPEEGGRAVPAVLYKLLCSIFYSGDVLFLQH